MEEKIPFYESGMIPPEVAERLLTLALRGFQHATITRLAPTLLAHKVCVPKVLEAVGVVCHREGRLKMAVPNFIQQLQEALGMPPRLAFNNEPI